MSRNSHAFFNDGATVSAVVDAAITVNVSNGFLVVDNASHLSFSQMNQLIVSLFQFSLPQGEEMLSGEGGASIDLSAPAPPAFLESGFTREYGCGPTGKEGALSEDQAKLLDRLVENHTGEDEQGVAASPCFPRLFLISQAHHDIVGAYASHWLRANRPVSARMEILSQKIRACSSGLSLAEHQGLEKEGFFDTLFTSELIDTPSRLLDDETDMRFQYCGGIEKWLGVRGSHPTSRADMEVHHLIEDIPFAVKTLVRLCVLKLAKANELEKKGKHLQALEQYKAVLAQLTNVPYPEVILPKLKCYDNLSWIHEERAEIPLSISVSQAALAYWNRVGEWVVAEDSLAAESLVKKLARHEARLGGNHKQRKKSVCEAAAGPARAP